MEQQAPLRLLVVDDQEIVGLGLRLALAAHDAGRRCLYAPDLEAALAAAARYEPRIALVGHVTGGLPPEIVSRRLIGVLPGVRTVLLTDRGTAPADLVREAGAWGSVGKDWPARRLVEAILAVAVGERPRGGSGAARSPLSPQQLEVLRLMAGGATNREIAVDLSVSPHTVKQHAADVYRRLGVRNRAQAVQQGQRRGLIA